MDQDKHYSTGHFGQSANAVSPFLSTIGPTQRDKRLAHAIIIVSILFFVCLAPYAKVQLPAVPAFLPAYQTAVVLGDFITFILLISQFDILRTQGLFVIACGYLFNTLMAVLHGLSFTGLVQSLHAVTSGTQTTAWLYFFWHGGFPLFVFAFILQRRINTSTTIRSLSLVQVAAIALALVMFTVASVVWVSTAGIEFLPSLMRGDMDAPSKIYVAAAVIACSAVVGVQLWRIKPQSLLDMWLVVILVIWICDVGLAAVFNHGRYDLGWYAGRIYGVLAASFVLMALLFENGKLYAQLAAANLRERAYLAHLHDPVVTIDARGTIRSVNPAVGRVLGYSPEEVVGRNVSMLMPEPQRNEHDGYLQRYLHSNEPRVIGAPREVIGLHQNGELVPLELSISEVPLDREDRQFIGTLRDLREQKSHFTKLSQARADAEQANRAKSAFLATMSHEIRTPLGGLLGMLELLSLSRLDFDQRKTLHAAWDSARGLLRIVNDVLDWSKIEEGKMELAPVPTALPQLLQEVVNTYSRVASAKALNLHCRCDSQLQAAYLADPLRLSQVLNNFVSNAIKFTQCGEVEVSATLQQHHDYGDEIRFSVRDTGPGIPSEVQVQLFQRYRQESAETARLYGGTGLGLAICQLLADLMKGHIVLESTPGMGSVFSIDLTLPATSDPGVNIQMHAAEISPPPVEPIFWRGNQAPIVLAVDDHPINRDLLARQLQLLGLRVITAESGEAALKRVKEGGISLVITDLHMPVMDGFRLSHELRRFTPDGQPSTMPIIAWTANASEEEARRCAHVGIDDILVKPSSMAQLKGILQKWLSESETLSVESQIDYAILSQVVADPQRRAKLMHDYVKHVRKDQSNLLMHLDRGDLLKSQEVVHRMLGASCMVGATRIAAACKQIERDTQSKNTPMDLDALIELDAAITSLVRELGLSDIRENEN